MFKHKDYKRKSRKGMDLVILFYSFMFFLFLITSFQYMSYDVSLNGQASKFYGIIHAIFGLVFSLNGSESFPVNQLFQIPTDILAATLGTYTLIYGGSEGTNSLIQSVSMPHGVSAPMPEYKIRRFLGFVVAWCLISLLITFYQMNVRIADVRSGVTFNVSWFYYGMGTAFTTYIYSRQAPKIGEGVSGNAPPPPTYNPPPPPGFGQPPATTAPPPSPIVNVGVQIVNEPIYNTRESHDGGEEGGN